VDKDLNDFLWLRDCNGIPSYHGHLSVAMVSYKLETVLFLPVGKRNSER
jgi:hypothetical protein